jgi:hypothetical protein
MSAKCQKQTHALQQKASYETAQLHQGIKPFKSRLRCALAARVRISAIIALNVRPSACAISRSLRSTSGATTLCTITTRSVRGERADNVRAMDCEVPLPLPLGSTVFVIATPAIT